MTFSANNKIEEAIFKVIDNNPNLVYSTGVTEMGECGSWGKRLNPTVIYLNTEGTIGAMLAIEDFKEQAGCCGGAERVESQFALYDISSGGQSDFIKGSNYCIADKECGGTCDKGSKKDTGTKVNFDLYECTKEKPCKEIHLTKTAVGSNKKSQQAVLKWNGWLKLKESGI
jgi:hypothetical protein